MPSASVSASVSAGSSCPAQMPLPIMARPKRAPSSSVQFTSSIGASVSVPVSARVRSTSSPASTPSAPSNLPPVGCRSRWLPISTGGRKDPAPRGGRRGCRRHPAARCSRSPRTSGGTGRGRRHPRPREQAAVLRPRRGADRCHLHQAPPQPTFVYTQISCRHFPRPMLAAAARRCKSAAREVQIRHRRTGKKDERGMPRQGNRAARIVACAPAPAPFRRGVPRPGARAGQRWPDGVVWRCAAEVGHSC